MQFTFALKRIFLAENKMNPVPKLFENVKPKIIFWNLKATNHKVKIKGAFHNVRDNYF